MSRDFEATRLEFRPETIRLLLVGESPPSVGGFFYEGDSQLAKHTRTAFEAVFGCFPDPQAFLRAFQSRGFYLEDLSPQPVDRETGVLREAAQRAGVERIAALIDSAQPQAVVVVGKSLESAVKTAAAVRGVPVFVLPFGGQGHQNEYIGGLIAVFDWLGCLGDC